MRGRSFFVLALLFSLVAAGPALAGTMSIAWDSVTDNDLVGYRVYYGPSVGNYPQYQDVGLVTTLTLSGLADCTTHYVAVKARDAAGNLSTGYSNEIVGMPRPMVAQVDPAVAEQGLPLALVITGGNFAGGATIQFSNPGITVQSVVVNSCTQITVNVTLGATAAVGPVNVDVTNTDGVFGSSTGLFAVQAATPPTVAGTTPANGATNISSSVHPTVTFSEPMKAASISNTTVKLIDPAGVAVAQAAGSPALSADGRTAMIVPAAPLSFSKTYRVQVQGGATGVRDLANNPMSTTYTQATGFTTEADGQAPTITAVAAGTVHATSVTITWTTDEPADSQVFYRKSDAVTYLSTAVDPALTTSHTMVLQGLTPSTDYAFYVRSADAGENATSSTPDGAFTTADSTYAYLSLEAENGTLTGPERAVQGAGAFRGAWIDAPAGTAIGSATAPAGKSEMSFYAPVDGTWYVWARLFGASAASDTWYESVDGAARVTIAPSTVGVWKWTAARSYNLVRGLHVMELGGREAQARADRVIITNDPTFIPTEVPSDDVTPPGSPTGLAAASGDGSVTLNWTNPAATDVARVIVRYRTDGRYPQNPADGFPVSAAPAAAGSAGSTTHTGLTNGTTVFYGVFAIDGDDNASAAAQIQATPQANVPPPAPGSAWRTDKR